jgi:hypothetical protein
MVSVIVVGRNDNYGVNLHKRTALSINSLAEILHDSGDEIIYVDCNTDDRDQTLLEAIADTLTPRAREITRVFRITGDVMEKALKTKGVRFSDELSRNVAIRRSNPANEWILSTNCDILIYPVVENSLGAVLRKIPNRFHVCPRVDIPYQQWWLLPRSSPDASIDLCGAVLRSGFCLPPEMPEEWLRFQSIGDFQLAPRSQWFEIRGCEEAMVLRGRSDTNNSKRLSILNGGGCTPDLLDHLRVFHLGHNFPHTKHPDEVALNERAKWVDEIRDYKSTNEDNWGLAATSLPEIKLSYGIAVKGGDAVRMHKRKRQIYERFSSFFYARFWKIASDAFHRLGLGKSSGGQD